MMRPLFWKATVLACALLVSGACLTYRYVIQTHKKDRLCYRKLMQESFESRHRHPLENATAYQIREKVQKDFWEEGSAATERKHSHIQSQRSKLTLQGRKEAIEHLQNIQGWVQDRPFQAQEGVYEYFSRCLHTQGKFHVEHPMGTIEAGNATMQEGFLVLENGVSLSLKEGKSPLIIQSEKATAPLTFSRSIQGATFQGDVKIEIPPDIALRGGIATYEKEALTLHPASERGSCRMDLQGHEIEAAELRFDLLKEELMGQTASGDFQFAEETAPIHFSSASFLWKKREEKLFLEKNVQLHFSSGPKNFASAKKSGVALADHLWVDLQKQRMILTADAPARVLFWQEGCSLSAPEIEISQDPLTHRESIEGKGDVHCTLNLEETNLIERLLSQYL